MTRMTAVIVPPLHFRSDPSVEAVRATDEPELDELFRRCSPETIALRFFGPRTAFPASYLRDVLAGAPQHHDGVIARDRAGGAIVGLASLGAGSAAGPDVPELGVLVADAWQRHGIGTAMVDLLVQRARARDVERLLASVLPGRSGVLTALGGLTCERTWRTRDAVSAVYRLA
jgi:RimJ/RimL family protein N-acetyltransferase